MTVNRHDAVAVALDLAEARKALEDARRHVRLLAADDHTVDARYDISTAHEKVNHALAIMYAYLEPNGGKP